MTLGHAMCADPTAVPPSLDAIWQALQRVTRLRFESRSQAGTGWCGQAQGMVDVTQPQPLVLEFAESGHWLPQTAPPTAAGQGSAPRPVAFRNVFRWTRLDGPMDWPATHPPVGLLRLEHLRQGPEHPVWLFDLSPADLQSSPPHWADAQPHLCGADVYRATLRLTEPGGLQVVWRINGPKKQETIAYDYT